MVVHALGNDFSASFSQFVRSMDPTYVVGSMHQQYKAHAARAADNSTSSIAHRGRYEVRNRNSTPNFGFGFQDNLVWTMDKLFAQCISIGQQIGLGSDDEKIAFIKARNPSLIEGDPNEDGERMFFIRQCRNDKHGWPHQFGNNEIIVQHGAGG
jgi:hypothetical protein